MCLLFVVCTLRITNEGRNCHCRALKKQHQSFLYSTLLNPLKARFPGSYSVVESHWNGWDSPVKPFIDLKLILLMQQLLVMLCFIFLFILVLSSLS